MRRLRDLMRAGCTLVLDEVDFFDPTLEAMPGVAVVVA